MCTPKELPFAEADPDNPAQVEVERDFYFDTTSADPTPLAQPLSTNSHSLQVIHLNINILLPKVDAICEALSRHTTNSSHAIFSEDAPTKMLEVEGFCLHRLDHPTHGGRVAVYVPSSLKTRRRRDLESEETEILWLEMKFKKHRILLATVYQPPTDHEFFPHLSRMLATATTEPSKYPPHRRLQL